jgi:hypothetical protein
MNKNIPPNFLFPTNFRNKRNVKRLIKDFYIQGYGIAVYLLEILAETEEHKYPLNDIDLIADELKVSIPTLQEIIKSYGLFEIIQEGEYKFFSPALNQWLEPYYKQIEQRKIAAQISVNSRKIKQQKQLLELSQIDSTQRPLNDRLTIKEESKEESKNAKQYSYTEDDNEKWKKWNEDEVKKNMRISKLEELAIAYKDNQVEI